MIERYLAATKLAKSRPAAKLLCERGYETVSSRTDILYTLPNVLYAEEPISELRRYLTYEQASPSFKMRKEMQFNAQVVFMYLTDKETTALFRERGFYNYHVRRFFLDILLYINVGIDPKDILALPKPPKCEIEKYANDFILNTRLDYFYQCKGFNRLKMIEALMLVSEDILDFFPRK